TGSGNRLRRTGTGPGDRAADTGTSGARLRGHRNRTRSPEPERESTAVPESGRVLAVNVTIRPATVVAGRIGSSVESGQDLDSNSARGSETSMSLSANRS